MQTGIYEHYKGNRYNVIDIARHSETDELLVLYRPMYGDESLWVRPFSMFFENVIVDGYQVSRFKYIGNSDE
ncbi:MAG: DUF1653 domain-containing protein [Campylobacterota bacterium]|nr:DUF1653 domain-containing protein [Campylobacterota bacterium]